MWAKFLDLKTIQIKFSAADIMYIVQIQNTGKAVIVLLSITSAFPCGWPHSLCRHWLECRLTNWTLITNLTTFHFLPWLLLMMGHVCAIIGKCFKFCQMLSFHRKYFSEQTHFCVRKNNKLSWVMVNTWWLMIQSRWGPKIIQINLMQDGLRSVHESSAIRFGANNILQFSL